MASGKTADLINRAIDGGLPEGERAILEEILAGDPEARRLYDDLLAMAEMLSTQKELEAPPTLKAGVMRALEKERVPQVRRRPVLDGIFESLRWKAAPRLAFAFSGGLVAGVLLYIFYTNIVASPALEASDVTGTLMFKELPAETGREALLEVRTEPVQGSISTKHYGGVGLVSLRLTSREMITTQLSFDPTVLNVEAVRRFDGSAESLVIRNGEVEVRGTGSTIYNIFFSGQGNRDVPVRVAIRSSEGLLFQDAISLQAGKPG